MLMSIVVFGYRESFLPYVDTCFQEIFTLINFPHDDVRSAALTTLAQLCINIHKIESQEGRQGKGNIRQNVVKEGYGKLWLESHTEEVGGI